MTYSVADFDPAIKGALPSDFQWGYATAATQIEGSWDVDGKGVSIWDKFSQEADIRVDDKSTCKDTCRSYDLFKEDVARMKAYGVTGYRFSFSWTRIIPLGGKDDPINEAGIEFYNKLIDELLANGITPFGTIFHWDTPQTLEDRYGGFLNKEQMVPDFLRYARVCFERFGDRIKNWITVNEPGVFSLAGYAGGAHAPCRSSINEKCKEGDTSREPWLVGHTLLVAHGYACDLYKREFQPTQKGSIMITLSGNWSEPWDAADPKDIEAAERSNQFEIAWFADPLYGKNPEVDYPACMREQLGDRLPHFTEEEKKLIRGSSEYYGMNSYTSFYKRHRDTPAPPEDLKGNVDILDNNKQGQSRGPETDTVWLRSTPWGWGKLLRWIWKRYEMPIYITENGTTAKGEHGWKPQSADDVLEDPFRVEFYKGYLTEVATASQEGVIIKSFFAWSFMDNWEWSNGFTNRFGVTWVDFASAEKKRYAKRSAYFMKDFFNHMIRK
ncbi:uncharacterized protein E0L32_010385 [Thyridium curvatum]|uniref:beta-glucosidase n=1 Tax=Thyridium curvatum TaxID=1093900 RepID=A0A507AUM7_9PEZI|nr:uncharacterized protein E0L32_010385 [Thyridium curvatum]TPX07930.1 hypothetical protein E0L32_010385 [Thyridium curvatum]